MAGQAPEQPFRGDVFPRTRNDYLHAALASSSASILRVWARGKATQPALLVLALASIRRQLPGPRVGARRGRCERPAHEGRGGYGLPGRGYPDAVFRFTAAPRVANPQPDGGL